MRTIDPDKHSRQRATLIAAARRVFARLGFGGASTAMVQAEAGTSSGKLFHYFPSKQALILAVIEDHNNQTALWTEDLLAGNSPLTALELLIAGVWQTAANPEERNLALEIAAEAARNPEAKRLAVDSDRLLAGAILALVSTALTRDLIRPGITPDQITHLLMAWIDGIFSRAGSDPNYVTKATADSFRAGLHAILGLKEPGL